LVWGVVVDGVGAEDEFDGGRHFGGCCGDGGECRGGASQSMGLRTPMRVLQAIERPT
jgi:hypothetical protein